MTIGISANNEQEPRRDMRKLGGAIFVFFVFVTGFVWMINLYVFNGYVHQARNDIERQLVGFAGRIQSELNRMSLTPLHLSQDSRLIDDLVSKSFSRTSLRLFGHQEAVGSKALHLLNDVGRLVATTERERLTEVHNERAFYVNAVRSSDTVFSSETLDDRIQRHFYSRRIQHNEKNVGIIVVEIDLGKLFDTLPKQDGITFATDSAGRILFSTESRFHSKTEAEALAEPPPASRLGRVIRFFQTASLVPADLHFRGQSYIRVNASIPFQGWKLVRLSDTDEARAAIDRIIVLEIAAIAILFSLMIFGLLHRRQYRLETESRELRMLNARLEKEIRERRRTEKDLERTRLNLARSEKLAALGELSASVSHELNQPLSAVRTYVASSRALLDRNNREGALAKIDEIDELAVRMANIIGQLRAHARETTNRLVDIDFRRAIDSSLAMTSGEIDQSDVQVVKSAPEAPVMVAGDLVLLDQVIVNLIRNALDAMDDRDDKQLELRLGVEGKAATLSVTDNGTGFENPEKLFLPFYTTKSHGLGLGLAISSGIAKDLGGRLSAENAPQGGAVFHFRLPVIQSANSSPGE